MEMQPSISSPPLPPSFENPTDTSNWLINSGNKAGMIVGSYPTDETIDKLLDAGITVFVNLCDETEIKKSFDYYRYIYDKCHSTGQYTNVQHTRMVMKSKKGHDVEHLYGYCRELYRMILNGGLLYVHSLKGYGRVSLVGYYTIRLDSNVQHSQCLNILDASFKTRKIKLPKMQKLETKEQYSTVRQFDYNHKKEMDKYNMWKRAEEAQAKKHGVLEDEGPPKPEPHPDSSTLTTQQVIDMMAEMSSVETKVQELGKSLVQQNVITQENFESNDAKYHEYFVTLTSLLRKKMEDILTDDDKLELDDKLQKYGGILAMISPSPSPPPLSSPISPLSSSPSSPPPLSSPSSLPSSSPSSPPPLSSSPSSPPPLSSPISPLPSSLPPQLPPLKPVDDIENKCTDDLDTIVNNLELYRQKTIEVSNSLKSKGLISDEQVEKNQSTYSAYVSSFVELLKVENLNALQSQELEKYKDKYYTLKPVIERMSKSVSLLST